MTAETPPLDGTGASDPGTGAGSGAGAGLTGWLAASWRSRSASAADVTCRWAASLAARACAALLRAHGSRAGAYLSPRISGWTERVVVAGRPVDEAVFAACVEAVREATASLPDEVGETTQFEVLTVAALLAMAESGVEAAALEAGLGGRLDATNVVDAPLV